MPTIRLVPSTYALSNSTYLSMSNADNMYTNTDSDTYSTCTNSQTGTTTYYVYLRGFNFDAVPENATVTSFAVKFKARESGASTSSTYRPYMVNNTTTITGTASAITTTATPQTFTGLSASTTWNTIKGYGNDFGIRFTNRRNARNTTSYLYIYGAEIEVTYTVPVYHSITVTGDSSKVSPTGTASILEGSNYQVTMNYSTKPTVTDNGNDVSSQLTTLTSGSTTLIPTGETATNFTITDASNAYANVSSTNYARLDVSGSSTGTVYYDLQPLALPSNATIQSVTCQATLQYNRNSSSSGFTASCRLYAGSTAKGSSTSVVSSGGTDVAKTTFNLTPGTWTVGELANPRFYITATNSASSTHRYIYVYGVSMVVTYAVSGTVYVYTLTNVTADHTIVVTEAVPSATLYVRVNGSWVAASAVYKKVNGSWVQQNDLSNVFTNGMYYRLST